MTDQPQPSATPAVADCLFCRIVAGQIPATIVVESETTLAFRDVAPVAPVHVLVVPKAHHRDLATLAAADSTLAADVLTTLGEVARVERLDHYRVVFNTGERAGQSVFHVHGHVIGGRDLQWPPG
jgi:histidine triad (HIT) family protein